MGDVTAEMRGGGATELDFFLGASGSTTAVLPAGWVGEVDWLVKIVAGRGGISGVDSDLRGGGAIEPDRLAGTGNSDSKAAVAATTARAGRTLLSE